MNTKSAALLKHARKQMRELSRHPVLSKYWPKLSLVLKGSTARGNADRYSDIDLVFYCAEDVKKSIVRAYHEQKLIDRTDGVFVIIANGHYHVESYEHLAAYFAQKDFIHCWEVEHTVVLSDPAGQFRRIVKDGQRQLFKDHLDIVKRAYLELQLDLDWMRMPITRGDALATLLHVAKVTQGLSRIAYLLDGRSYPPDKWIGRYLSSTRWGRTHGRALRKYVGLSHRVNKLVAHAPFAENPLYQEAAALSVTVSEFIRKTHGDQPWTWHWWNYVF